MAGTARVVAAKVNKVKMMEYMLCGLFLYLWRTRIEVLAMMKVGLRVH